MLGLLVGALIFDALTPFLGVLRSPSQSITLPDALGVPYGSLALTIGLLFLLMIRVMDRFDPALRQTQDTASTVDQESATEPLWRREWGWLSTGLVAGVLIYVSSWQGQYLSIVSGYSTLLAHLLAPLGYTMQSVPALSPATAWRAALVVGLIPGAFLSSLLARSLQPEEPVPPLFQEAFGPRLYRRGALVFLSGVLLAVGADIGGGCTTGAFMSGWPTLSVGNLLMGMTFFMAAMAAAQVMYWGKGPLFRRVRARGLTLATD